MFHTINSSYVQTLGQLNIRTRGERTAPRSDSFLLHALSMFAIHINDADIFDTSLMHELFFC